MSAEVVVPASDTEPPAALCRLFEVALGWSKDTRGVVERLFIHDDPRPGWPTRVRRRAAGQKTVRAVARELVEAGRVAGRAGEVRRSVGELVASVEALRVFAPEFTHDPGGPVELGPGEVVQMPPSYWPTGESVVRLAAIRERARACFRRVHELLAGVGNADPVARLARAAGEAAGDVLSPELARVVRGWIGKIAGGEAASGGGTGHVAVAKS